MDRLASAIGKIDLLGTLAIIGIAFVFGTLGGAATASTILYHRRKVHRIISLGIGLGVSAGVMASVFVSSIFMMHYLGFIVIKDANFIVFASLSSGSIAVILLMSIKKITKVMLKYKGSELTISLGEDSNNG